MPHRSARATASTATRRGSANPTGAPLAQFSPAALAQPAPTRCAASAAPRPTRARRAGACGGRGRSGRVQGVPAGRCNGIPEHALSPAPAARPQNCTEWWSSEDGNQTAPVYQDAQGACRIVRGCKARAVRVSFARLRTLRHVTASHTARDHPGQQCTPFIADPGCWACSPQGLCSQCMDGWALQPGGTCARCKGGDACTTCSPQTLACTACFYMYGLNSTGGCVGCADTGCMNCTSDYRCALEPGRPARGGWCGWRCRLRTAACRLPPASHTPHLPPYPRPPQKVPRMLVLVLQGCPGQVPATARRLRGSDARWRLHPLLRRLYQGSQRPRMPLLPHRLPDVPPAHR